MLGLGTMGDRSGKGRAVVDPTNELMSGFRHCSGFPERFDPLHYLRVLGEQVLAASVVLRQQQKEQERQNGDARCMFSSSRFNGCMRCLLDPERCGYLKPPYNRLYSVINQLSLMDSEGSRDMISR